VLEESGQAPLAYVAAGTYGLDDEAARLAEAVPEDARPPLPAPGTASLLLPPAPVLREDNWPLISVAKGFFETLAAKSAAAAAKGGKPPPYTPSAPAAAAGAGAGGGLEELEGAGWGDDDDDGLGLGASAGEDDGDGGLGGGDGDAGWDMEDLDLPGDLAADVGPAGSGGGGADGYVAPTAGVPASQRWLERRDALAAEHCAAGQFGSAMQLLFRQLGAVRFEALRGHMLELYYASHTALPGLPVSHGEGRWAAPACLGWEACRGTGEWRSRRGGEQRAGRRGAARGGARWVALAPGLAAGGQLQLEIVTPARRPPRRGALEAGLARASWPARPPTHPPIPPPPPPPPTYTHRARSRCWSGWTGAGAATRRRSRRPRPRCCSRCRGWRRTSRWAPGGGGPLKPGAAPLLQAVLGLSQSY
jgi:hypothetical protein